MHAGDGRKLHHVKAEGDAPGKGAFGKGQRVPPEQAAGFGSAGGRHEGRVKGVQIKGEEHLVRKTGREQGIACAGKSPVRAGDNASAAGLWRQRPAAG